MFRTLFPRDLFAELDRIQRELQQPFNASPSIRGPVRGGYPALNLGTTPGGVEIHVFAPGLDPAAIELDLERGVLTIAGERRSALPGKDDKASVHVDERFAGRFRRVVSLPDDIDAAGVQAAYRDGVLRITVPRRAAAGPRRIDIA